jgi:hypothetical protein
LNYYLIASTPSIRWKRRDFLHPKLITGAEVKQSWSHLVVSNLENTDSLVPGLGDVNPVLIVNGDVFGRYEKAGLPPPGAKLV